MVGCGLEEWKKTRALEAKDDVDGRRHDTVQNAFDVDSRSPQHSAKTLIQYTTIR